MEFHLIQVNREHHVFSLIDERKLKSYCELDGIANYSESNKFNIFHDEGDLADHLETISDPICETCLKEFNQIT